MQEGRGEGGNRCSAVVAFVYLGELPGHLICTAPCIVSTRFWHGSWHPQSCSGFRQAWTLICCAAMLKTTLQPSRPRRTSKVVWHVCSVSRHTRAYARTRARMHTRTHTHTHFLVIRVPYCVLCAMFTTFWDPTTHTTRARTLASAALFISFQNATSHQTEPAASPMSDVCDTAPP